MRIIPYIYIAITLFITLLSSSVKAQSSSVAQLKFDNLEWNFGDIAEDGGKVEHIFTFTNTSSKPVVILEVTTGCGCTTSSYSRKPVMPGAKGEVTVLFDPMNLPGRFNKSASILTSASSQPIVLKVEGNVIPRKKSVQEEYPFDLGGGVRLAFNHHDFAYVGRGERVEQRIGLINTSSKDATLKLIPKQRSELLEIVAPSVLRAGERADLIVRYAIATTSTRYGTLNDLYGFEVNGLEARAVLSTTAIAVDRFDRSVDDISLPSGELSKKIIKFGNLKRGNTASDTTVELLNEGESDLIIRAVEWQQEALKCSFKAGDRVKAGERVVLRLDLDSRNCDYGVWVDRLRIITNDPVRPMQSIRITAIVED